MSNITTIRVTQETKELLTPYKKQYGTYEKAIKELIAHFENLE